MFAHLWFQAGMVEISADAVFLQELCNLLGLPAITDINNPGALDLADDLQKPF